MNTISLDTLCAALCAVSGVDAPSTANSADTRLLEYADKVFNGKGADRIFMYNPDAVAEWIYRKYPQLMREVTEHCDLALPYCTVMPSVTPVCFGTMYTGAQPAVHGIQKYEKPIIRIETIFDAFIKAGKKCAIVADGACSIGKIFLERDLDYFVGGTFEERFHKTLELIERDEHDLIVVYNGNYDSAMHKNGPESVEALSELRLNSVTFSVFHEKITEHWGSHNTLIGFAMDHGCHEIDGGCGSHGLDMDEDLDIVHLYKGITKKNHNS